MDRDDVDTFDLFDADHGHLDRFGFDDIDVGDLDLPTLGGGGDLPPPEPPEPPRRPRPSGPGPHDAELFSGWLTLVVAGVLMGMVALQLMIMNLGARGGQPAVYLCMVAFGVLFLGPFVLGSIWFDRLRRSPDP